MLLQLGGLLATGRTWNRIYEEIGFNVKELKLKKFDRSFALFQSSSIRMLAIETYNIFDDDKHYNIVSISKILNEICANKYQLQSLDRFDKHLKEFFYIEIATHDPDYLIKCIEKLNKIRPNFKNNDSLKKVKNIRDNYIAHYNSDNIEATTPRTLPSIDEFEALIKWADSFRILLFRGFLPGVEPVDIYEWSEDHNNYVIDLICQVIGPEKYIKPH